MADASDEMLINLNSPEKINNAPCQTTYLKNPLIPGPDVNCNIEINNPFDIVANSAENWDPFELVLRESLKKIDANHNNNHVENKSAKLYKVFKTPSPRRKKLNDTDDNPRKVLRSQSVTENVMYFGSSTKSDKLDSDTVDDTCSIRERIRNVVKQRVSVCNESKVSPSLSQPDLRKTEGNYSLNSMNDILSQILGKSTDASVHKGASFNNELQNRYTISREMEQNNSNAIFQEIKFLNKSAIHKESDHQTTSHPAQKIDKPTEELTKNAEIFEILEEAKNMSFVFQNMSLRETNKADVTDSKFLNCYEESLMDVKPPWEENDESSISSESEDSSIGLPKIKLFYMKKKDKKGKEISSEELENYKKRIRASIDGNVSCDEESSSEPTAAEAPTSGSAQDKLSEKNTKSSPTEKEPLEALAVNKPALPEVNDLRPKKKGSILKKGPMKALVPLQKMTKSIAEKMSSPRKRSSPMNSSSTKSKQDNSFSSSLIHPVAASTPNGKSSSKTSTSDTPVVSKTSFRNRLSRKDNEPSKKSGSSKRSVSLSSETRNSNGKLPFSTVNSNVKRNTSRSYNRPHTAPTNTKTNFSPKSKENTLRNIKSLASNDKENRMQVS